ILALASNKKKLEALPTKVNPKVVGSVVRVDFPKARVHARHVTIDDFESFSKVRKIRNPARLPSMLESNMKRGMKKILGEGGSFQDWGGEPNDLYSKIRYKGKRLRLAMAFKGKGTSGILTLTKMG